MKRTSTPSLPVLLDMEKAFDRCSWEFLEDGLAAIGFGQGFIDYVLCSRTRTRHTANTPPTRLTFPLGSGVARRDAPPPLLFLIIADPLMRLFNQNRNIYGIAFRPETRPIAMKSPYSPALFAEDSTLILRTADIQDALRTLHPNLVRCNKHEENETTSERSLLLGLPRRHPAAPRQQARAQPTRDPNTHDRSRRHHHPRPRRPNILRTI